jgi:hypothetical protein
MMDRRGFMAICANRNVVSRQPCGRDVVKAKSWAARCGHPLFLLLWLALFLSGCKENPRLVKAGPLFATEEKTPPAKAVVYIYWPREEQGRRSQLWVGPCEDISNGILPGGYISFVAEPGPICLQAEMRWGLARLDGVVVEDLAKVEWNGQPGQSSFVRLEQEKGLLRSHVVLRLMKPEAATPEIGRCRRSIPLSFEEMLSRQP